MRSGNFSEAAKPWTENGKPNSIPFFDFSLGSPAQPSVYSLLEKVPTNTVWVSEMVQAGIGFVSKSGLASVLKSRV